MRFLRKRWGLESDLPQFSRNKFTATSISYQTALGGGLHSPLN